MIKQKILPLSKDMVLSLKLRSKLSKKKSLKKNASLITISFFKQFHHLCMQRKTIFLFKQKKVLLYIEFQLLFSCKISTEKICALGDTDEIKSLLIDATRFNSKLEHKSQYWATFVCFCATDLERSM